MQLLAASVGIRNHFNFFQEISIISCFGLLLISHVVVPEQAALVGDETQTSINQLSEQDFLELFSDGGTISIFIMGLTSGNVTTALRMMKDASSRLGDRPCILLLWQAGSNFGAYDHAIRQVASAGQDLIKLCSLLAEKGSQLILFGHSLGSAVVTAALKALPSLVEVSVARVILSSAAEKQSRVAKVLDALALGDRRAYVLASVRDWALIASSPYFRRFGPKAGSLGVSICCTKDELLPGFSTCDISDLSAGQSGHSAAFYSKRHARIVKQVHDDEDWSVLEPVSVWRCYRNAKYLAGKKTVSIVKVSEDD